MPEIRRMVFTDWPSLETRLFIAYHGEPPAWGKHSRSANAFYSFWFVERGRVKVRLADEELTLSGSQWVVFPPHLRKRQDFSDGTVIYSVGFEAAWTNGLPWMRFDRPIRGALAENERGVAAAVRLISLLPETSTRGYRLLSDQEVTAKTFTAIQAALVQLLAELVPVLSERGAEADPAGKEDLRLDRILREIRHAPSIRPLPYARWQKEIGLSRVRIDRLAREKLSLTPKQVRDNCLLTALKRVFLARNASVKEAAVEFGFSDSSHLCRWFRKHAGISPTEYRTVGTV